ncbi:MAG: BACON domain-containing protein [Alistipes sp.]|nr:BACON domain-containing protein [Alistipes sp.]
MKKFRIVCLLASLSLITGCAIEDAPAIQFYQESYTVSQKGGEVIIPVNHTGINDATISFRNPEHNFEYDNETGDMTPIEGWCKITKIIDHYDMTRDLAQWDSGVVLHFEPNDEGVERTATLTIYSFNIHKSIVIKQAF